MDKTINVVSTPNIEGNIGSCTVQSNEVTSVGGIMTWERTVVQVNSCTGEIINEFVYVSYAGLWTAFILGGIFLLLALKVIFSRGY